MYEYKLRLCPAGKRTLPESLLVTEVPIHVGEIITDENESDFRITEIIHKTGEKTFVIAKEITL